MCCCLELEPEPDSLQDWSSLTGSTHKMPAVAFPCPPLPRREGRAVEYNAGALHSQAAITFKCFPGLRQGPEA